MRRNEVMARLKASEPTLRARGVAALYLYGSHARDEAGPSSDIDILVDLAPDLPEDLVSYMAPYRTLQALFPGAEIGYGARDNIAPRYRSSIEASAVRVF